MRYYSKLYCAAKIEQVTLYLVIHYLYVKLGGILLPFLIWVLWFSTVLWELGYSTLISNKFIVLQRCRCTYFATWKSQLPFIRRNT